MKSKSQNHLGISKSVRRKSSNAQLIAMPKPHLPTCQADGNQHCEDTSQSLHKAQVYQTGMWLSTGPDAEKTDDKTNARMRRQFEREGQLLSKSLDLLRRGLVPGYSLSELLSP